jgi:endonuclease/exonuclease/phosphatase family metal-dependent hydrolase
MSIVKSPHYDNDFISLEGEVSTFSSKGNIVLIGDFNSRTGQNPDFIEKDSSQKHKSNKFVPYELIIKS